SEPDSAVAFAGSDRGAGYAGSDGPGAEAGGRSRQGETRGADRSGGDAGEPRQSTQAWNQPSDQRHGATAAQYQQQHHQHDLNHLDHEYYVIDLRHQPEYTRQPERHRLPGKYSVGYGDCVVGRQQHEDHPEPADSRAGRTEGHVEDWRPGAGGNGIVPAGYWWSRYQSSGQYSVSIPRRGSEYRHHAAGSCGAGNIVEIDDGRLGGDFAREHRDRK